jgi:hypothetical protein
MSTQESMTSHSSITFGISSSSRIRKTRAASPLSSNCQQRLSNQSSITSHQFLDEERSRKKSRIASLLSSMKNQSILCSCISDAPLSSTLNLLGSIPDDLRKRKLANESNHDSDDIMSCTSSTVMRNEALAVIIHFLSLDCTVSFISTNTSNTSSARKFRKSIIAAPTGPSGSVAHDFIVCPQFFWQGRCTSISSGTIY